MDMNTLQDALIRDLAALFKDFKLHSSINEASTLHIYRQFIPIRVGEEEDPETYVPPEPLVHHRRGIDRYLRAHAPVRMLYRLLGRYILKLCAAFAPERAAAAGEQYLFKLSGLPAHQTLKDGRMLRIDGNYLRSGGLCRRHDDLACANERLLICKRYALFFAYRGKRRTQSDRAGNGGHDTVGLRKRRGFN